MEENMDVYKSKYSEGKIINPRSLYNKLYNQGFWK